LEPVGVKALVVCPGTSVAVRVGRPITTDHEVSGAMVVVDPAESGALFIT
jgi:hypothetical protein